MELTLQVEYIKTNPTQNGFNLYCVAPMTEEEFKELSQKIEDGKLKCSLTN